MSNRRLGNNPLFKVGAVMMTLAVAFGSAVVVVALHDQPMDSAPVTKPAAQPSLEPLVRSYLPQANSAKPPPQPGPKPRRDQGPGLAPRHEPQREVVPVVEADWQLPTEEEIKAAREPRHYELLPGAIMGLTIRAIGVHDVPVFDSDGRWALENGVGHVPETSLPWSRAPQRNVYIEGHRLGWPGTGSHLVFYHLNKLKSGDEVVLKDRDGKAYRYRVSETLKVNPDDVWVMGQVRGRDMVTLQTCVGPNFSKRLIVRADRV